MKKVIHAIGLVGLLSLILLNCDPRNHPIYLKIERCDCDTTPYRDCYCDTLDQEFCACDTTEFRDCYCDTLDPEPCLCDTTEFRDCWCDTLDICACDTSIYFDNCWCDEDTLLFDLCPCDTTDCLEENCECDPDPCCCDSLDCNEPDCFCDDYQPDCCFCDTLPCDQEDCDCDDFQEPCCECDVTEYDDPDCPCDDTDPPFPTVSYSNDIQSIWDAYCLECHNGIETPDLRAPYSYNQIVPDYITTYNLAQSTIYTSVESGAMPDGGDRIPQEKIDLILEWLYAGYPNN